MRKKRGVIRKAAQPPQEDEIAVKLVRQLDGYCIADAIDALSRAESLLKTTQIVSARSSLLG
jgi:hypothetical protein